MIPTTTFGQPKFSITSPGGTLRKCHRDKPKFTGHRHRTSGILDTNQAIPRGATAQLGRPHDGSYEWP
jgi:hypothetical protein